MKYQDLEALAASARNPVKGKPVANHTYLRKSSTGRGVVVRLHSTDILRVSVGEASGVIQRVDLDTGGWNSVTTIERMRRFWPAELQEAGLYPTTHAGVIVAECEGGGYETSGVPHRYIPAHGTAWSLNVYGDTFAPVEPTCQDLGTREAVRRMRRLLAAEKRFASAFVEQIKKRGLEAPSAGDCWACYFRKDGQNLRATPPAAREAMGVSHLLLHLGWSDEETGTPYFVPTLAVKAAIEGGAKPEFLRYHTAESFGRSLRAYYLRRRTALLQEVLPWGLFYFSKVSDPGAWCPEGEA